MNGFIEIYVDDVLRYRWLFTLRDYESFSFQQQVDLRIDDLNKIIVALKENVVQNFDPARTQFQIAYESKMNYDGNSEMPEPEPDEVHHGASQNNDSPRNG